MVFSLKKNDLERSNEKLSSVYQCILYGMIKHTVDNEVYAECICAVNRTFAEIICHLL